MKSSGLSMFTRVVVLAAFYFVGGLLGKASAFMGGTVSLVWPSSGIALAGIMLFGYRFWPGVAAGAALFTLVNGMPLGYCTLGTALGNTVGAVTCAYLLERIVKFRTSMERVSDVAGFVLLACVLGTTVNAAFTVVGMIFANQLGWDDLFSKVLDWWVPNAMGTLVVAPIIMAWGSPSNIRWRTPLVIEAVACMAGLLVGTLISFNSWYVYGVENYPLAYLPYPFLAWSALRFGQRGATTATLILATLAIGGLLQGQGPFVTGNERTSITLVGCYIGVLAVTNMLLAAVAAEREHAIHMTIQNDQRYRAVVEDQTDLICRFNRKGLLTFVNDSYCRFHQKRADELLGTSFLPSLPEQDREIPLGCFLNLCPTNPTMSYDDKILMGHTYVWQQCTIHALFDTENNVYEFQAVIQDITRRKESEEAARIGAERMRAIMDSMVDGVIVAEEDGMISSFNPAAELVFQCRSEEVTGQPIRLLFEKPELYDDYLLTHLRSGETKIIEMGALRPNSSIVPIDLAVSEISQSGLRVFIIIVRDISERKKMEEQFRQSQKMETIGRLAGGIAHDFNNLLQALLGYSNFLHQRLAPSDPNRESVEQIQKTVDRARSLTQQLLAFSRKQKPTPKVHSLNAVVSDMHQLLNRLIGEAVCMNFKLGSEAVCVRADHGQLEQIVLNLSINARDAMPRGGILTIKTDSVDLPLRGGPANLPPGPYALLSMSDTGCGIPPEVLPRLFEPFFTTKEAGKGTGLGLSIVYGIIKNCGGTIEVTSQPGHGTRFDIYIPRVAAGQHEDPDAPTRQINTRGQETILLVEDEELVLLMLTELLKAEGYNILDAPNGAQALEIAQSHQGTIDLLVTDMSMPELTGWELAIRLEQLGRKIPVLYMSGYTDDEAAQRGVLLNCADFLQKPFQPATLLVKMRQILETRKKP